VGGRVPGAEAPCFSVAGNARTEVRAYLRSKSKGKESVRRRVRWCGLSAGGVGTVVFEMGPGFSPDNQSGSTRYALAPGIFKGVSPGAEAACFSVAGNARTEVRAYLRSESKGWRECTPWVSWRVRFVVGCGATERMVEMDVVHLNRSQRTRTDGATPTLWVGKRKEPTGGPSAHPVS
jgi:hypothetical protein